MKNWNTCLFVIIILLGAGVMSERSMAQTLTLPGWKSAPLQLMPPNNNLGTIQFISHNEGWTAAQPGILYHSLDSGSQWIPDTIDRTAGDRFHSSPPTTCLMRGR